MKKKLHSYIEFKKIFESKQLNESIEKNLGFFHKYGFDSSLEMIEDIVTWAKKDSDMVNRPFDSIVEYYIEYLKNKHRNPLLESVDLKTLEAIPLEDDENQKLLDAGFIPTSENVDVYRDNPYFVYKDKDGNFWGVKSTEIDVLETTADWSEFDSVDLFLDSLKEGSDHKIHESK